MSTWTEVDKQIAARALKTLEQARPSQRIRSAGLLGLSGGRAQSGVGIEVSMTLHESNHGTQNGKNGPVH
jgi:hypothetical protein